MFRDRSAAGSDTRGPGNTKGLPPAGGFLSRRPVLAMMLVIGGGGLLQALSRLLPRQDSPLARTPVISAIIDDPDSPFSGPASGETTLVIFTDYRCPVCRASNDPIQRVLAADTGVKVLYKDWPILGARSVAAAKAALAADRQGRYAAMHDALMRAPASLDDDTIETAAGRAGVDLAQLRRDLVNHADAIEQRLGRNSFQAWSIGLRGTPAFLVGTYLVTGAIDARRLARLLATVCSSAGHRRTG